MTFSVKQIQERYGVSQGTALHWIATGQLKALNLGRDLGKQRARYRITQNALDEFEATRTIAVPQTTTPRRRRTKQDDGYVERYK
jgi:transposase